MKTINIAGFEVPKEQIDKYIKFQMMADAYLLGLLGKSPTPSNTEYEKQARWSMCVQEQMKLHKQICIDLGIKYNSFNDKFYNEFHKEIEKQIRLKG